MSAQPPSLAELQHGFAAALVAGDTEALAPWVRHGGIEPGARLRIYRHAGQAIHVDALATGFPALRRWVGETCFDALAVRYAAQHGSRSGNLQDYGSGFADFVAVQAELDDFPWLADLARLEWLRQESLLAGALPTPSDDQLAATLAALDGEVGMRLQPHVRVLLAAAPVLDLWRYAMHGGVDAIDPQGGLQGVLVWRVDDQVAMSALNPVQARVTAALLAGVPLSRALAQARAGDDVAGVMQPLLAYALVAEITPEDGEETTS